MTAGRSWSPAWHVVGAAAAALVVAFGLYVAGRWWWAALLAAVAGGAAGVAWERFWYARTRAAPGTLPAVVPIVAQSWVSGLAVTLLPSAVAGAVVAAQFAMVAAVCAARLRSVSGRSQDHH